MLSVVLHIGIVLKSSPKRRGVFSPKETLISDLTSKFPVACYRGGLLYLRVDPESYCQERIPLCMADSLPHCFSGQVPEIPPR